MKFSAGVIYNLASQMIYKRFRDIDECVKAFTKDLDPNTDRFSVISPDGGTRGIKGLWLSNRYSRRHCMIEMTERARVLNAFLGF